MECAEIVAALKEKFGEGMVEFVEEGKEAHAILPSALIADVCSFLRDDPRLACDLLSCVSAVDLKGLKGETDEGFEIAYHIESTSKLHCVALRTRVPRDKPSLPTVSSVWETANWHEREAFDLMGVEFSGHPNLVRILCAEDWVGHPLRKDYVYPTEYHGIICEFEGNEDGTWGGHLA